MIGNIKSIEKVCSRIKEVTKLNSDLVDIIKDYAVISDLPGRDELEFDELGKVTKPKLRELYKETFMSFYAGSSQKDWILFQIFRRHEGPLSRQIVLRQNELRKIFEEIANSGYRLCLDNLYLDDLRLTNLNFANASMRSVKLSNSTLFKVNMSGADLTGSKFKNCFMLHLDLTKADLTGTDFETCKQADIIF